MFRSVAQMVILMAIVFVFGIQEFAQAKSESSCEHFLTTWPNTEEPFLVSGRWHRVKLDRLVVYDGFGPFSYEVSVDPAGIGANNWFLAYVPDDMSEVSKKIREFLLEFSGTGRAPDAVLRRFEIIGQFLFTENRGFVYRIIDIKEVSPRKPGPSGEVVSFRSDS